MLQIDKKIFLIKFGKETDDETRLSLDYLLRVVQNLGYIDLYLVHLILVSDEHRWISRKKSIHHVAIHRRVV